MGELARHPVVLDALARCRFPRGDRLTCAVSGGADSAALLILASATGSAVHVVHVDHGLRDASEAEAERVRELAARCGATFDLRQVEVGEGPNLEARAREARHAALPQDALLAHTADDRAETVLLQLLRGGALDALASMAPDRRPLLELRRRDTEAVCRAAGYEPVEDPFNTDPRFRRTRMRHEVLPLLDEVMDRDVTPLLNRSAELAAEERRVLDQFASALDPTDAVALAGAPVALARRAIRRWLADPLPPDAGTVERVLDVARGDARATDVGAGRRVLRTDQRLRLEAAGESTGSSSSG